MYQRILVAIDSSETAQLALNHAVQLAKDQRARLRIAHVVEVLGLTYTASMAGGYPFDSTTLLESLREAAWKLLQEAEAKARSAEVEVEAVLLENEDPGTRGKRHRQGGGTLGGRSHRGRHPRPAGLRSIAPR
ncbi:MAG TPA: universal stress protein [Burkholderiaceae bacterium]|nr:universal stress protein [Burkholderiaceae bacterium]